MRLRDCTFLGATWPVLGGILITLMMGVMMGVFAPNVYNPFCRKEYRRKVDPLTT